MKNVNLYAFGRCTVKQKWDIDRSRIVNRLYYVNGGNATILNGANEHKLTEKKLYIIPQCKNFQPIDATDFDHTYFDFYSSQILRPDKIIELDESSLGASYFFKHINSLIDTNEQEDIKDVMELYLSGFMSLIEEKYKNLYYISSPYLTRAVNIIHDEYSSITTSALAKRLNLSESYFIRLFSSTMGISPMKYIRAVKVSHGKEFIRSGESVSDVAELCGYSSPSAFYKAVKNELDTSPKKLKSD